MSPKRWWRGDGTSDFANEREAMVEHQLRRRGIGEPHILDAFRQVPREAFVSEAQAHLAYGDHPLPIESGQTISQPYIVALMIQAARVSAADNVLEIGAGSGYAAALLSRIARSVTAIERHHELADVAAMRLRRLGFDNVALVEGDGTKGWTAGAPYDAILVAASGPHVPAPLVDQLAPGGRLVMPIGDPSCSQRLIKLTKALDGGIDEEFLCAVRFVPLIGDGVER